MHVSAVNSNAILLGLTGYATVGKDEAADHLVREHGYVKLGWADPLYQLALKINPSIKYKYAWMLGRTGRLAEIVEQLGWTEAKKNPAIREFLQLLGTEWCRDILGQDVWIDALTPKIKKLMRQGKNVVITNTRFANEAGRVLELGGRIIKISREGVGPVNAHKSDQGEAFQFAFAEIENDNTIEALGTCMTVLHESILDERGEGLADESKLVPDVMVANYKTTVNRAMAIGISTVLRMAAPVSADAEDWASRCRKSIEQIGDASIEVTVNGQLAGNVEYEDGVVTVDAFLAR